MTNNIKDGGQFIVRVDANIEGDTYTETARVWKKISMLSFTQYQVSQCVWFWFNFSKAVTLHIDCRTSSHKYKNIHMQHKRSQSLQRDWYVIKSKNTRDNNSNNHHDSGDYYDA